MTAAPVDPADGSLAGRPAAVPARRHRARLSVARLVGHRYALVGTMSMLAAAAGTVLTR